MPIKTDKRKKVPAKPLLTVLDLGCGQNKTTREAIVNYGLLTAQDNFQIVGVDRHKVDGVDKLWDLTKFPYPFAPNSIDAIHTSHFVEHLDGPERIKFFNEVYRILKKGKIILLIHPYYKSARAVQDPTHKWPPIAEESYWYWDKNFRKVNKLGHYLGNCDFDIRIHPVYADDWGQKSPEVQAFAAKHYFNVISDLYVFMVKR